MIRIKKTVYDIYQRTAISRSVTCLKHVKSADLLHLLNKYRKLSPNLVLETYVEGIRLIRSNYLDSLMQYEMLRSSS